MKTHIITIGDEILLGQIVDTNSTWIAEKLREMGGRVNKMITVADELEPIEHALEQSFKEADVILMTGGLGPTRDDITKKAIANYFRVGFVFSQTTFEHIERLFEGFGRPMSEAHREQCLMPQNAELLTNKMGSAPGMLFENEGKILVSMPGVPYEMKYLMKKEVLPLLRKKFQPIPLQYRTILTAGAGETVIAGKIETFENNLPPYLKLAYLPNLGKVRIRLTATGGNMVDQNSLLETKGDELQQILGDMVYGEGTESFTEVIGQFLRDHGLTMATAESCTGGYIAHQITAIPGSSDYFKGGVIAYSNEIKMNVLSVSGETLQSNGAVSEATVKEMLSGLIKALNVDLGIAVSGIAGPGGGTPEKPVGTIWIAIGNDQEIQTAKLQLGKDRLKNIEYAAIRALNMLRLFALRRYRG